MVTKKKKKQPCAEGCNDAEYRLVNGEEITLLCRPSFNEQVSDLVVSNAEITFTEDGDYADLPTFKVG